jgi:pimeloyl-ACP methyl ester carboxylesterase
MTVTSAQIHLFFQRAAMRALAAVAPRAALARALDLFITPPRFPFSSAELRLLDSGRAKTVATPFGNIATWRIGDAHRPAVVLCHGWGGRGAQLRAFVNALLAAGYQVILFDHLGHGKSQHERAALVDFWRGVEAVWDDLIDDGVGVHGMIAHSLGGAAVASALRRSLTRKHTNAPAPRVVLIAPPASLIRYSRMFAKYLGLPERVRSAMQWRFESRYGVNWEEFELPHSVSTINAPALFIHDTDDRETKHAGSVALAQTWPDARMLTTNGLGHRRILASKDVINATVDFLQATREFLRPATNPTLESVAPLY